MISPQVIQELLTVRQVLHYLPASPKTEKGWTAHEQQLFWDALSKFPQGPWTTIAEFIGTKSTRQAMTHGQKLRQKLNRWRKRLRRTPAAALALSDADTEDDLAATLALTSVMMTSSVIPPAMMQNTSPVETSMAMAWSMAMPTMMTTATSGTTTSSSFSTQGVQVDDVSVLSPAKTSSRASNPSFNYSTMTTCAGLSLPADVLSQVDADYTEFFMASLPFASSGTTTFASSAQSPLSSISMSSSGFNRTIDTMASTTPTPTVPSSFVSSGRLAGTHHFDHQQPRHAAYTQASRRAAPRSTPSASTLFINDVHYVLPQAMVDDLTDVLWDY
uniref:Myb-like domain-containing protein n=1 Tax=Globisporangium ultimum (strain ATCC 200006 / CBS 805.95 / DAOM BR144) TaxID=431595 RepID=K3WDQ8_GLOUD